MSTNAAARRPARSALAGACLAAVLGAAVLAMTSRDALAHGGRFIPPPPMGPPTLPPIPPIGGVPPPKPTTPSIPMGPGTPPSPPPTTPTTPTPPGAPVGTGAGPKSAPGRVSLLAGWRAWWDANADSLRVRRVGSRSGAGSAFRAVDPTSGNRDDADRPTRRAVDRDIVPTLRWALGSGAVSNGDAMAASAIALGKTTDHPDDVATLVRLVEQRSAPELAREGAAIALGLLRRSDDEDAFDGKTLDDVREALFGIVDDERSPNRVRAFAALAIGLLGDQPCNPCDAFARDGRLAVRGLWTRLDVDWPSEDIPVALLVALSLQPREGVPSAVIDGLREACVKGRLHKRSAGFLTRAHAALALARLGDGESVGVFLGIAKAHRHDVVLRRSCVTALSVLAERLESPLRVMAAQGLGEIARSGDAETAGLALASIGRLLQADFAAGSSAVADTGAVDALFVALDRGSSALRPFASLAIALATRATGRSADVPAFALLREKALPTLRDLAADEGESAEGRGAFCIALGLLQDERGVGTLVKVASRRGNPTLRADACAALGVAGYATPEALAALRAALETRASEDLRRESARALGLLGDVSSVPLLLKEITSGAADHVLARAAIALGEMRDVSAVPALSEIARDPKTSDLARAVVLAALGLVGDLEPRPSLSRLGVDSNYLARTDALSEALSLL